MHDRFAIDRNRAALFSIVMMLFGLAGIARGGVVATLPRGVRSLILRSLRAADAACRRLVVMKARLMEYTPGPTRAAPTAPIPRGTGNTGRVPAFPLFDPRKSFAERRRRPAGTPQIFSFGISERDFPEAAPDPTADDPLDARRLCSRLESLARALEDLSKQAKRMIRAEVQRRSAPPGPRRVPPLRPGWPPGYRRRGKDPIDEVLYHCHCLARQALNPQRRTPDKMVA